VTLHVVRVFVGPDGRGGNPLGVFLDGAGVPAARRQAIAAELGFSETVWVEERTGASARIAIHTPAAELAFAGHPCVGTSWLLRSTGRPVDTLLVRAGAVATWEAEDLTWIRARAAWVHPIAIDELTSPEQVDGVEPPRLGEPGRYVWAWQDEGAGRLRARYFPTDLGIAEDEATGAAAVVMGERLGRPVVIRQGVGSQLLVRPGPDGTVEVGGRTEPVEVREATAPG
jgi:predicted PhzF superfamily epimerase YddE/YHI9